MHIEVFQNLLSSLLPAPTAPLVLLVEKVHSQELADVPLERHDVVVLDLLLHDRLGEAQLVEHLLLGLERVGIVEALVVVCLGSTVGLSWSLKRVFYWTLKSVKWSVNESRVRRIHILRWYTEILIVWSLLQILFFLIAVHFSLLLYYLIFSMFFIL